MSEKFDDNSQYKEGEEGGTRRRIPIREELEAIIAQHKAKGTGYDEYVRKMMGRGAIEISKDGKEIIDLNNGSTGHHIEDRLGLERGTVIVWADDEGKIYAHHPDEGSIDVLPEDESAY